MAHIYADSTEYVANALTIRRGVVDDITAVGVFHTGDENERPAVGDFTPATLVDGTATPPDALSITGVVDVISLIGPRGGIVLGTGTYFRWVLISTSTEDIIRRVGTLEVV